MVNYNIALLSLPAYYVLVFFPHAYAMNILTAADKTAYKNGNPRSHSAHGVIQKTLSPPQLARYERAKAAHTNGHESFPLFATAIVVGSMAGVDEKIMSAFAIGSVAMRALYTALYINTEKEEKSVFRSLVWITKTAAALGVIIAAGLTTA